MFSRPTLRITLPPPPSEPRSVPSRAIASSIHFYPASRPHAKLLHICKGGILEVLQPALFPDPHSRKYAFSCSWDNGSGQCLRAMAQAFKDARHVAILTDLDPYGIESAGLLLTLLKSLRVKHTLLGINDKWIAALDKPRRAEPRPLEECTIPLSAADRRKLPALERKFPEVFEAIGPRSHEMLRQRRSLNLECFFQPRFAKTVSSTVMRMVTAALRP